MTVRALLWDVDGTLAETERDGHRVAFNRAFEAAGLDWHWDIERYGELLAVAGGVERVLLDLSTRADAPPALDARTALARDLHRRKNALYAEIVSAGRIPLREGVREMIDEARARDLPMGIVSTTSRANVEALLGLHLGADWQRGFAAIVCGEDVGAKKPDPEAYRRAVAQLDIDARDAVAIEDSPLGATAARAAGVPVVIARSVYFPATAVPGALAHGPGLHTRNRWRPVPKDRGERGKQCITLDDLVAWHAKAAAPLDLA